MPGPISLGTVGVCTLSGGYLISRESSARITDGRLTVNPSTPALLTLYTILISQ